MPIPTVPTIVASGAASRRRLASAAGSLTLGAGLVLGLAACGSDDDAAPGGFPAALETARNDDVFNSADVDFATAMIPHHAQALQMALLAQDRPLEPEVRALVEQIQAAQAPEVETMATWLTDWGKDVPATSMDHEHAGHDMEDPEDPEAPDHTAMPGMMSQTQMDRLATADDDAFAELWLTMMIEHHRGAIEMAETEQQDGHFPDAVALAESIARTQAVEIATMEDLLG